MKYKIPEVPIAFFDLDDTLINKDTNSLWTIWRAKNSLKGKLELINGLLTVYIPYKRGKLTAKQMNTFFWFRTIFMKSHSYKEMSQKFFNEKGKLHIYDDAIELVKVHKDRGIHIVMITGQDDYVSYPFFSYFNMDGLISNKRIVKDSKFIGFEEPNCYGEGKVMLAKEYAEKKGINLADCALYTDSISDLPLLKSVNNPIVVNPDPELKTMATGSGWPIINLK